MCCRTPSGSLDRVFLNCFVRLLSTALCLEENRILVLCDKLRRVYHNYTHHKSSPLFRQLFLPEASREKTQMACCLDCYIKLLLMLGQSRNPLSLADTCRSIFFYNLFLLHTPRKNKSSFFFLCDAYYSRWRRGF